MPTVNVKTAAGRIARTAARGGLVPHDRYIPVVLTDYVRRRIQDGDLLVEPVPLVAPVVLPPAEPAASADEDAPRRRHKFESKD